MLFSGLSKACLVLAGTRGALAAVAEGRSGNEAGPPRGGGGCSTCCSILAETYAGQVSYPGDTVYDAEQVYWSEQQSNTFPVCRFTPIDAQGVACAIHAIEHTRCQFAVKSGGHAAFKGGSNIQGGITIDLKALDSITVSSDRTVTRVGTGNRWENVYSKLDPMELAVIGGRNGDIGTGGLTLGGGISFFSGYHGWALDNVINYEVVIANGSIVNANAKENPDLYWALRGGGNNFGVVTTLDLETFDQGKLWGGAVVYPLTANHSIYEAYYWFNRNAATDPKGALIVATACVPSLGCFFSNNYEYTDPVVNPPIFDNFTSIPNVSSTERIATLLNLTEELKATQPDGFRQIFMTLTFQNDAEILADILNIWYNDIQPIINITDFLPALVFQPLTKPVITNFAKNGGNALGITDVDGELTIMDIDFQWGDIKDDKQVKAIMNGIISKSTELAKSRGLYNRYLYQNYAYIKQDVFSGYGKANKNRLIKISKEYDPDGVFQILQPGYFKLTS